MYRSHARASALFVMTAALCGATSFSSVQCGEISDQTDCTAPNSAGLAGPYNDFVYPYMAMVNAHATAAASGFEVGGSASTGADYYDGFYGTVPWSALARFDIAVYTPGPVRPGRVEIDYTYDDAVNGTCGVGFVSALFTVTPECRSGIAPWPLITTTSIGANVMLGDGLTFYLFGLAALQPSDGGRYYAGSPYRWNMAYSEIAARFFEQDGTPVAMLEAGSRQSSDSVADIPEPSTFAPVLLSAIIAALLVSVRTSRC
jgi:hypothetical protein